VLFTLVAITAVSAVLTQLRCVDAAREAALAAARGEPGEAAGAGAAPPGATVTVVLDGGTARAVVRAQVHPLGGRLPGFAITATSIAVRETNGAGS
jgi:hypothetical protein